MKKIFAGIGILVSIFSIFFFLLVADKSVYHNGETICNFQLSKSISGKELQEYAEKSEVTIRLVDFINTSFGEKELNITFINPDPSIRLGKRPSIFPKDNVVYQTMDETIPRKIKYFTIQNNDSEKIEMMEAFLETNGYGVELSINEPIKFSVGMLFSSLNIGFFALITILLILSIATYYVYRLKEIGILKLNGWSNGRISFRLLFNLLVQLYFYSLLCMVPPGIYVLCSDSSKIILYAKIYFLLCAFLAIVFLIAAFAGTFFIRHVNEIGAIKNQKNNQLIFYMLLTFKLVTTVFLLVSANTSVDTINTLNSTLQALNKTTKYDFHTIRTAIVPEETMQKKIDQFVDSLDDDKVFNYRPPIMEGLNIKELQFYQSSGRLGSIGRPIDKRIDEMFGEEFDELFDEFFNVSISTNMIDMLGILDVEGNKVKSSQLNINSDTLLVPIHYQGDIQNIFEYFQLEKDPEVLYIQNGQVQDNIRSPGLYVYDAVHHLHKTKKTLYIRDGAILFNAESAELVEKELTHLGLDKYSITVQSMNMEYNTRKTNAQLDLFEAFLYMIINGLSFLLCTVAIIIIYLELRKKEFGVYKLIGRYPVKAVARFVGVNWLVTILAVLIINPIFLLLLAVEGMIYGVMIQKYMSDKAILALKGE